MNSQAEVVQKHEQPTSLLEVLVPVLESAPAEDLPLLLAWLERLAADKYRGWAKQTQDEIEIKGLLECAYREDAIAEFIELVEPESESRTQALKAQFPDMEAMYDSVLAGQDRREQLRRQAEGELGGATFLRQFAQAHSGAVAAQFEALAFYEEANSSFLSFLIK
ncbi:MAG: hypothetical protein AAGF35_00235 [Pseudomonadota bacterium]